MTPLPKTNTAPTDTWGGVTKEKTGAEERFSKPPGLTSRALSIIATIDIARAAQLRVVLSSWRRSGKIELRLATATIPGIYFPTANGVALNVEHVRELVVALQAAEAEARKRGLLKGGPA
jgi:hypothetical protein